MKNKSRVHWEKRDEWWIKRFIRKDGSHKITHHFGSKTAQPFPEIILNTRISRQLAGYLLIEKDLKDLKALLIEHEKRFQETPEPENDIILQALMKAIVVTYGKCFAEAKERKITLNLQCIPKESLNAHQYMIEMRNKYVAHADKSLHERIDLILLLPPHKKIKRALRGKDVNGTIKLQKHLTQSTTNSLLNDGSVKQLTSELLTHVQNKISKLNEKLGLDAIDPVLFWEKFPKVDKIILKDNDLNAIKRSPT